MSEPLICGHCHWEGTTETLLIQPSTGNAVCPQCWSEGFVATPGRKWGGLIGVLCPDDPGPREPKPCIDWSDEEWKIGKIAERIEHFRNLLELATVYVPTSTNAGRQRGFDFMRSEFKVAKVRNS